MNTQTAATMKQFRKAQGWTQQQLAVKLNVAVATVVRWEHGRSAPSNMALDKLKWLGFQP